MASLTLMDLNDDVLRLFCVAAAHSHPPHWDHPGSAISHGQEDNTRRLTFCLGWIYLSHVNRRLREICLASSSLWAGVVMALPGRSTTVMDTLLSRARTAPLTLSLPPLPKGNDSKPLLPFVDDGAKIAFMVKHLDRAVAFTIPLEASRDARNMDWRTVFANRPLQELRYLEISQDRTIQPVSISITTPNLVALKFANSLFPLATTPMCSLRRLALDLRLFEGYSSEISSDMIIDLFCHTPLLEDLDLIIRIFVRRDTDLGPAPRTQAELAYLRSAKIQIVDHYGAHFLWSRVRVPENIQLQMALDVNNQGGDPSVALSSVRSQLALPIYDIISFIRGESACVLYLSCSNAEAAIQANIFILWINVSEDFEFPQRLLHVLPQSVCVSNITELHLQRMKPDSADAARLVLDFVRIFPASKTLTLKDTPVKGPLNNSGADFSYMKELFASSSLLPALQKLRLMYYHKPAWTDFSPERARDYWNMIVEGLRHRAAIGKPVQTVMLSGYRFGSAEVVHVESEALKVISSYVHKIKDDRR